MSKAETPKNKNNFKGVAPNNLQPYDFQWSGVEYMHQKKFVVNADDPGLGKTIQTILLINYERPKTIKVVAPAALIPNWKAEFKIWCNYNPIIEYSSYNSVTSEGKFDFLVLDEFHYLKNFEAKRTQNVLSNKGLIRNVGRAVALSGTPFLNYPIELFPLASVFSPESVEGLDRVSFGMKFCRGYLDSWGQWNFNSSSNEELLGKNLRNHLMVRREKIKVLPQLPPLTTRLVCLNSDSNTKALIEMLDYFEPEVISGKYPQDYRGISVLNRELGLRKIKVGIDYINTMHWSGYEKIVIFTYHREVTLELARQLNADFIIGGVSAEINYRTVTDFQKNSKPFLVVSLLAGGVGYNLTVSNYCVIFEPSYIPAVNLQAIDRLFRIGQKNAVLADILIFKNSLDERKLKLHFSKNKIFKEILNE